MLMLMLMLMLMIIGAGGDDNEDGDYDEIFDDGDDDDDGDNYRDVHPCLVPDDAEVNVNCHRELLGVNLPRKILKEEYFDQNRKELFPSQSTAHDPASTVLRLFFFSVLIFKLKLTLKICSSVPRSN